MSSAAVVQVPSHPASATAIAALTTLNMPTRWSRRYAAVRALKAGTVPCVLISGGSGHSTIYLYNAVREHPVWHYIPTHEGRHEAEVCVAVCVRPIEPLSLLQQQPPPALAVAASSSRVAQVVPAPAGK